jgi:hypothetical protein
VLDSTPSRRIGNRTWTPDGVVLPLQRRRPVLRPDPVLDSLDMTEAQLTSRWKHALQELGLLWHHHERGVWVQRGLPDFVILGRELWLVEIKSLLGTLSPEQELWRVGCKVARVNYAVHTPKEWLNGDSLRLMHQIKADADVVELKWRKAA